MEPHPGEGNAPTTRTTALYGSATGEELRMEPKDVHSGHLDEERKAVFQPVELAIKHRRLAGKRTDFLEEIFPARKAYSEELKRDLDEIMQAIIEEESLNKALSLLGTKYAIERTLLAEERNIMAEERNLLGEKRTRRSQVRTELAEKRSGLARLRTFLAKNRTFLAEKRTSMAMQRTTLAKARTHLAFIRTGVALVALGSALTRYFGLGWWTFLDGSILVLGIIMVGQGIYFYVLTRKEEGRVVDIMRQKEEELMRRKPRILVLDDDLAVCKMLKVYLEKSGYEVEAFTNPHVARQRLESSQFDVVITDLMMEGMTGKEILQLVKRISPQTQVIMITHIEEQFLDDIKGELFAYFSKPVDIKKLLASVKDALEERMLV